MQLLSDRGSVAMVLRKLWFHVSARSATMGLISSGFLPRDAMHARHTSHGPVSVCLSQVGVLKRLNLGSYKQHDWIAQGLVFWRQRSPRNSTGVNPCGGAKCRWSGSKSATCPTVTLQRHNFVLFRTCRTSSLCTVAQQLARFQPTRRIARSLGDS